eukprot:145084-Lingulodinium_polyedra.AAC.1
MGPHLRAEGRRRPGPRVAGGAGPGVAAAGPGLVRSGGRWARLLQHERRGDAACAGESLP